MDEKLLDKSKRIEFPYFDGESVLYRNSDSDEIRLPVVENCRYSGWKSNSHHYTTKYHREIVLPSLDGMFCFGYSVSDFVIENQSVKIGESIFDLSHVVPVDDVHFRITHLVDGKQSEGGFDVLRGRKSDIRWFYGPTSYHSLYRYPHSFSRVDNLDSGNGRSLLVLGDSQMIPSIPVLCRYYGSVTYVDNRYGANAKGKVSSEFDDVLIAAYNKPFDYYIGFL